MQATLLVELLTEELPPTALAALGESFGAAVFEGLQAAQLVAPEVSVRRFATPRRLAVQVPTVRDKAADSEREVQGPSLKIGLGADGKATAALAGFAKKNGVAVEALERRATPKGEVFVARVKAGGANLDALLADIVDKALKKLPIPKLMRWGDGEAQFVRPAHGLVMLHGERVVPGSVLGMASQRTTRGHRFMGQGEIVLASADQYEARLREDGSVIADFAARRAEIERQLGGHAATLKASLGAPMDIARLVDEVTALVEYPSVYVGEFDAGFLEVPQECLILTMRQNQKYFPLFGADGKLLPKFLIVSNMRVDDPRHIVAGNQRVVRPRLQDARFFYDQDRRERLEARVPRLAGVVFHHKLGTQLERVQRLQQLAGAIARRIGADALLAERAAWLSKADLLTGMVGEFPELQGIMGAYYARHDREPEPVVEAIREQYRLRLDDDADSANLVSAAFYIAERIELLIGMFAVGHAPTGEKDPFALRRAALGLISAYELLSAARKLAATKMPEIRELFAEAAALFPSGIVSQDIPLKVYLFVLERYRHHLASAYSRDSIDAVLSLQPPLAEVVARVRAVETFRKLPESESLAAANKRIRNILQKSPAASGRAFSEKLLAEPAERNLLATFQSVDAKAQSELREGRFGDALSLLAALKSPVDIFFDRVMVNVEDEAVRNNRLMLLERLNAALNRVADISKLAT